MNKRSLVALLLVATVMVGVIAVGSTLSSVADSARLAGIFGVLGTGVLATMMLVSRRVPSPLAVAPSQTQATRTPIKPFIDPLPGPGRFCVSGIDHQSGWQTTEYVSAESPEQAMIKVELKGVDVICVTRVRELYPHQARAMAA